MHNRILVGIRYLVERPHWGLYRKIILSALQRGYRVISLYQWYQTLLTSSKHTQKFLILRHDIDHDVEGAKVMFEIEKKLGVHSTFYFRWSTVDKQLIKKIRDYGSEVGLHYETVATYTKQHQLTSKEQITPEVVKECRLLLKDEVRRFQELCGEITSIASHGDPINAKLQFANNEILKGEDLSQYSVLFEAYQGVILDKVRAYISDAGWPAGFWKYGTSPISAVNQGIGTIMFLSHPCHWSASGLKRLTKLAKRLASKRETLEMKS